MSEELNLKSEECSLRNQEIDTKSTECSLLYIKIDTLTLAIEEYDNKENVIDKDKEEYLLKRLLVLENDLRTDNEMINTKNEEISNLNIQIDILKNIKDEENNKGKEEYLLKRLIILENDLQMSHDAAKVLFIDNNGEVSAPKEETFVFIYVYVYICLFIGGQRRGD